MQTSKFVHIFQHYWNFRTFFCSLPLIAYGLSGAPKLAQSKSFDKKRHLAGLFQKKFQKTVVPHSLNIQSK